MAEPLSLSCLPFINHQSLYWVSTSDIRSLNPHTRSHPSYHHLLPTPQTIIDSLQNRSHIDGLLSQRHPKDFVFWYQSYPDAARAASTLRARGMQDVQMTVVWAKNLKVYSVETMAGKLNRHGIMRRAKGRLFGMPLTEQELRKELVVRFEWMGSIVHVPGISGHVQAPKHVLDQRKEDGDADTWGKLARGLLEEIYLTCGRTDLAKCDALLTDMASGDRSG